jgi:hypothetical protein
MHAAQKLNADRTARAIKRAEAEAARPKKLPRSLSKAARLALAKKQSMG